MATVLRGAWSNNRTLTVTVVVTASTLALGFLWRTFFMRPYLVKLSARLAPEYDRRMFKRKRRLFDGLQQLKAERGDGHIVILEIGSGTGANFQHYPDGSQIVCVDCNSMFEAPLRASLEQRPGIEISQYHVTSAENMRDVGSSSVDAVVSTKVLCSVGNVDRCLQEILRVLKPVSLCPKSITYVCP